jgi:hypothetical protein
MIGTLLSNRRCRRSWRPFAPSPNIDPHNVTGFSSGAPTTFSITYGRPDATRSSGRFDQVGVVAARPVPERRERLARAGRVDRVERPPP